MKLQTYFILFSLILLACNPRMDEKNRKAAQEGLKNQEIKQVTDAEIIEEAYKRGRIISEASQKALGSKLTHAIAEGGVPYAIEFCNVVAYDLVDSLSKAYMAQVKRVSLDLRNPKDAPDELEKQILQAYQYSLNQGMELTDNVQMLENNQLLYSKPIVISTGLCLNCHGEIGKQVKDENYQLIRSIYPNDSAINHKIGDLRGMWSIRLSKKDIIKAL